LASSVGSALFSEGFVTVNFSGMGSLATRPTPNQEDQRLHVVWPLPNDMSDMAGATSSLRRGKFAVEKEIRRLRV
jgi:hypothetical protein